MTVENARERINEALIDIKLENETRIWENIIINFNQFTPHDKLNCSIKRYNNQCNFNTWYEILKENGKVALFIFLGVAFIVAAIVVCCCAYYRI